MKKKHLSQTKILSSLGIRTQEVLICQNGKVKKRTILVQASL